jgi:hypothetical protein
MNLLQRMDRLVYVTRIDRLLFMKVQPRTFRWTPLFVFAALVVGYVLMAKTGGVPSRTFFIGWMLFYGAFLATFFLRLFGPRFLGTTLRPLDERELMVKARAYALSGIMLAGFAMLGCFYMASEGVPVLWHPHTLNDWISLGFGFQAAGNLLPTWIASWLEPRPTTDNEDLAS